MSKQSAVLLSHVKDANAYCHCCTVFHYASYCLLRDSYVRTALHYAKTAK